MAKDLLDKVLNQAQTPVNIRSIKSDVIFTTTPNNSIDNDPLIADALNRILVDYGVSVSVKDKAKNLLKFGRNPNVGSAATGYTIWYTGQDQANETYVADNVNSIDSVSSNNINDTEIISIEGHTMAGGNKTFVVQTVTLQGQVRVPLPTPLNRCTRIRHAQQSSTNLVGEVYAYENTALTGGKPTDTTKIHITVPAGQNNSEKASTSLSSVDYWIVTGMRTSVLEKATNVFVDTALQIRPSGGVFVEVEDVEASSVASGILNFSPYLIVPANSDVRLVAVGSTTGVDAAGSIQGFLAS